MEEANINQNDLNAVIYYEDSAARKGLGFANGYVDGIGKEQKVGANGAVTIAAGAVETSAADTDVLQPFSVLFTIFHLT